MRVIYDEWQKQYIPRDYVYDSRVHTHDDVPERLEAILKGLISSGKNPVSKPNWFEEDEWILKVHEFDYVDFLKGVSGTEEDSIPFVFRNISSLSDGRSQKARLGEYIFDTITPLSENIFEHAKRAVNVALTGAEMILDKEKRVYSLCRPSGHHAGRNFGGGYCYLNNAAIAVKYLIKKSGKGSKIAILDIDYDHGNGTQDIFYSTDVLFVSLHFDPTEGYPYFWGFSEERGEGRGEGLNYNIPLPKDTDDEEYLSNLISACEIIYGFKSDFIVVSVGYDTCELDGGFKLTPSSFRRVGSIIKKIDKPLLFIQEGGYNLSFLEEAAKNFSEGVGGI